MVDGVDIAERDTRAVTEAVEFDDIERVVGLEHGSRSKPGRRKRGAETLYRAQQRLPFQGISDGFVQRAPAVDAEVDIDLLEFIAELQPRYAGHGPIGAELKLDVFQKGPSQFVFLAVC